MPTKKTSTKKNNSSKFSRFSRFNPMQLFAILAVFSFIGAFFIYQSQAAPLTMPQLAARYHCPWFYTPAPMEPHATGPGQCPLMLKFILKKYAGGNKIKLDGPRKNEYGDEAIAVVKTIKTYVHLVDPHTGKVNGTVGIPTWQVIQAVYLKATGQLKSPGPIGPDGKPNFSNGAGKLNDGEKKYFNAEYNKWGAIGQCIIQVESGGNYSIDTGNGFYGAFQFLHTTWASGPDSDGDSSRFRTYYNANQAPPDIQWLRFFEVWAEGANAGAWPVSSKICT
jgi:hypothetical protein